MEVRKIKADIAKVTDLFANFCFLQTYFFEGECANKKCLEFKDANAQLLKNYNDVFDFEELGKMAIDYSDGIVTADKEVNETLLNYTKSKNLPLLEYPGEDYPP